MAPPKPRRRTRVNNTSAHQKGASSKERLDFQSSNSAIECQAGVDASVLSASTTRYTTPFSNTSLAYSALEQLPVEVTNHILSYLVQPRSRLPGLTEQESALDSKKQRQIKLSENLRSPPDTDRFAADLFAWTSVRHPFNALAASSRQCHTLVESYCAYLVKTCNRFHLPFAQAEDYGADSVYPSLSSIVYRRLWLQTAPRDCLFCGAFMSEYPHRGYRLMLCCASCFYTQTLSLHEVQHQYHIIDPNILTINKVSSSSVRHEWILRIDVEALALQLYGTRAFHDTQSRGLDMQCSIPNCGLAVDRLSTPSPPQLRRLPSHVSSARNRRRAA